MFRSSKLRQVKLREIAFFLFLLRTSATASLELEILAPAPREIFCQPPIPLVIALSGDSQDTALELQVSVDGKLVAIVQAHNEIVDLELEIQDEGLHEIEVHAEASGNNMSSEARAVFYVRSTVSADELLRHAPKTQRVPVLCVYIQLDAHQKCAHE